MLSKNPYNSYSHQAILTMTPGELLIKLFDEAIKRMNLAIMYIDQKETVKAHNALIRSQLIVKHLNDTLQKDYSFSGDLAKLYDFILENLQQANIKKDTKIINDVLPLITELRETFAECDRLTRKEQFSGK